MMFNTDLAGIPRYLKRTNFHLMFYISSTIFFGGAVVGYLIRTSILQPQSLPSSGELSFSSVEIATGNFEVIALIALGGFLLGIPTIVSLVSNGIVFGVLIASIYRDHGFMVLLVTIFPHGILEILAICLAGMIGLRIARHVILLVFGINESPPFDTKVVDWVGWFVVASGLILVAGVIEVRLTPWLALQFLLDIEKKMAGEDLTHLSLMGLFDCF